MHTTKHNPKTYNFMQTIKIIRKGFKCGRCEHEWVPNNINTPPIVCPNCKSPYWNKPRKNNLNKK